MRAMHFRYLWIGILLGAFAPQVVAQSIPEERRIRYREQSLGIYQPFWAEEIWKKVKIPPSPALSPKDAHKSFRVAPGFRLETVAAEPLIVDPVMFEFDPDGRIWAVELRGYMQDIEGSTEGDPIGQIVVLEDTDGDTIMDKSTVFLGGLVMARTVQFVHGGVLIQEPPNLWFCEDTDGDLKCDRKRLVGKFGVPGDPQHTDNALFHAIDNWMYNAKSKVRHKFIDGKLIEEETFFRGQWGMNQDDYGRLYYCYESAPLHVDLVPAELMYRSKNFQHSIHGGRNSYGLNIGIGHGPAREIYPIRVAPGITLGATELRPDGTLRTFTIAAGISIYRGDQFPKKYYGCAVIPEAGGNLVRLNKIESEDGVHLRCRNYFGKREWLASTDERFRPLNSRTGPDGAVYFCDMYKGIIEHVVFMMPYLRRHIARQGLGDPIGQGRIYRIRYEGKPLGKVPRLSKASSAELVGHLSHPNGWWRDTSQRLLVERMAVDQAGALEKLATGGVHPLGRLHALWTLEGIGRLDWKTVAAATGDHDAMVRATAIRLSARFAGKGYDRQILDRLDQALADKRPMVGLQLLLALGAFRDGRAEKAMVKIVSRHPEELFYASAVSGLAGRELEFIQRLLKDPGWQKDTTEKRGLLAMLAMAVFNEHDPTRVSRLMAAIDEDQTWRRDEMTRGILGSHFSRQKWPTPLRLPARPAVLETLAASNQEELEKTAAQLARVVTWPGDTTERPQKPNPRPLTPAEEKQFTLGRAIYAVTCHACHHDNGQGQARKAPPLLESEWVNGPPERLVRIALHGLTGPVKVRGQEWKLAMPGLGQSPVLNDERMAAVLTYVRRAWGNWGDPIEPEVVAKLRKESSGRRQMWTVAELLNPGSAGPTVKGQDLLAKYRAVLDQGDAERGRILFHTNLAHRCQACHTVGVTGGGFVGPDLTVVATRGKQDYLLESLIDPSAKIAKGFDTIVVLKTDGTSVAGTFVSEDDKQLVLAPPTGGKVPIAKSDIDERFVSPISSMPPVAELFTPVQISDLIAYLATLKKRPPKKSAP